MVGEGRGNGQMSAFWLESVFIGRPGQSEFLAFGGDPVRGCTVGVAINVVVSGFSVRIVTCAFHFLLDLRFLAGRVIRSRVTVIILAKKDFFKANCIMFTPFVSKTFTSICCFHPDDDRRIGWWWRFRHICFPCCSRKIRRRSLETTCNSTLYSWMMDKPEGAATATAKRAATTN